MEPTTIFLAAVAFIGVSHLATSVTKGLRKNKHTSYHAAGRTRSDWYCFFSRAALYGKNEEVLRQQDLNQKTHARKRPRSSQQARPRLYK